MGQRTLWLHFCENLPKKESLIDFLQMLDATRKSIAYFASNVNEYSFCLYISHYIQFTNS